MKLPVIYVFSYIYVKSQVLRYILRLCIITIYFVIAEILIRFSHAVVSIKNYQRLAGTDSFKYANRLINIATMFYEDLYVI